MPNELPSGHVANLLECGNESKFKSQLVLQNDCFKVMRLALPAGKVIPEHQAPKEITVQCITGLIEFTSQGTTRTMTAGSLLHLGPGEQHSLAAIEESIVLVTMAK